MIRLTRTVLTEFWSKKWTKFRFQRCGDLIFHFRFLRKRKKGSFSFLRGKKARETWLHLEKNFFFLLLHSQESSLGFKFLFGSERDKVRGVISIDPFSSFSAKTAWKQTRMRFRKREWEKIQQSREHLTKREGSLEWNERKAEREERERERRREREKERERGERKKERERREREERERRRENIEEIVKKSRKTKIKKNLSDR